MDYGGNLGLVARVLVTLLVVVELGEACPVIRQLTLFFFIDQVMFKELLGAQAPVRIRL